MSRQTQRTRPLEPSARIYTRSAERAGNVHNCGKPTGITSISAGHQAWRGGTLRAPYHSVNGKRLLSAPSGCGVSRAVLGLPTDNGSGKPGKVLAAQRLSCAFRSQGEIRRSYARITMAHHGGISCLSTSQPNQSHSASRAHEYVTQANRHGYG
jgi:hypothetical protein